MATMKINHRSDFPPMTLAFGEGNNAVSVKSLIEAGHDFIIRFYIQDCPSPHYDCSYIGGTWAHMEQDGDKVRCYVDNHHLGCGQLMADFIDMAPSGKYSIDGRQKTVTPCLLDIELTDGQGDATTSIEASLDVLNINWITSISTAPSAVDGGANVVTITMRDGTTYRFSIRNGSKGADGSVNVAVVTAMPAVIKTDVLYLRYRSI